MKILMPTCPGTGSVYMCQEFERAGLPVYRYMHEWDQADSGVLFDHPFDRATIDRFGKLGQAYPVVIPLRHPRDIVKTWIKRGKPTVRGQYPEDYQPTIRTGVPLDATLRNLRVIATFTNPYVIPLDLVGARTEAAMAFLEATGIPLAFYAPAVNVSPAVHAHLSEHEEAWVKHQLQFSLFKAYR